MVERKYKHDRSIIWFTITCEKGPVRRIRAKKEEKTA